MAKTKVDNKLNVVIGTKSQIEGDTTIPENSILIVTDENEPTLIVDGDGNSYLANDGTYKPISGGGGGSATIPVVRMDKITNTIDLSSFGIPVPFYQLDIEPNKKYVIKSQPGTEGSDGVYVIFTPTGLDYTGSFTNVEYNDTEYKEFTIDIYFEKEATINFIDFTAEAFLYTKVNANVDYTVNTRFLSSIVLPGKKHYTISMVDGNVLIYGWE